MAVTANQVIAKQEGCRGSFPAAASTNFYQGTLAFVNASGYADDDVASGVNLFAGVVVDQVDNSAGSAGDLNVETYAEGIFELAGSGFNQASVGQLVYATDNYTVSLTGTAATLIGRCVGFVSSSKILVKIMTGPGALAVTAVSVTLREAQNIVLGTTTGTKIGTAAAQKLGLWGVTPVIQYATEGTTTGFTAGAGTASKSDSTFTGDTGTKAYTMGDVVRAAKLCGMMEA